MAFYINQGAVEVAYISQAMKTTGLICHVICDQNQSKSPETRSLVEKTTQMAHKYLQDEGFIPYEKGWNTKVTLLCYKPL